MVDTPWSRWLNNSFVDPARLGHHFSLSLVGRRSSSKKEIDEGEAASARKGWTFMDLSPDRFEAFSSIFAMTDAVPCQIEEGLFLGSVGAARNITVLKELNVTHILTVAAFMEPAYPEDFLYKKISVFDNPVTKLDKYFDECFNFIDEAKSSGGGVLVHCFAGRSRSVTIVVSYLMKKHHMTLSDALSIVRSKRSIASPNQGFISQLKGFEKYLAGAQVANST